MLFAGGDADADGDADAAAGAADRDPAPAAAAAAVGRAKSERSVYRRAGGTPCCGSIEQVASTLRVPSLRAELLLPFLRRTGGWRSAVAQPIIDRPLRSCCRAERLARSRASAAHPHLHLRRVLPRPSSSSSSSSDAAATQRRMSRRVVVRLSERFVSPSEF